MQEPQAMIQCFSRISLWENKQEHIIEPEMIQSFLMFIGLNLADEKAFSRQIIAGFLWPDVSDLESKKILSRVLYRLKQHVPQSEKWFEATEKSIVIHECTSDWELFLQKAKSPEITENMEAIRLCQGDLVAFESFDWLAPFQDKCFEWKAILLDKVANHWVQQQKWEEASPYLLQKFRLTPFDEKDCLQAMKCFHNLGDIDTATKIFEEHQLLLNEELSIHSSRQLQSYNESLSMENEQASSDGIVTDLIGRTTEVFFLLEQMDEVLQGKACSVGVVGQPKIGKTRLLEHMSAKIEWRETPCLWSRTEKHTSIRPFFPLEQMIQEIFSLEHSTLFIEDSDTSDWQDFQHQWNLLHESFFTTKREVDYEEILSFVSSLLKKILVHSPLCSVFEDVEFASPSFWRLMSDLMDELQETPWLCIFSFDSFERSEKETQEAWQSFQVTHPKRTKRLELAELSMQECRRIYLHHHWNDDIKQFNEIYAMQKGFPSFYIHAKQTKVLSLDVNEQELK